MQFQNSPDGRLTKKEKIFIAFGVVVFVAFAIFLLSSGSIKKEKVDTSSDNFLQTYNDPISGETVTDPVGKTPESYGASSDTPTYLGFKNLLPLGFTQAQLNSLFKALDEYSSDLEINPNEVSLYPDSVTFISLPETNPDLDIVKFDIQIARKTKQNVEITRHSLSAISLKILENGKELFSSGKIGALSP